MKYLNVSAIKKLAKERGKRTGKDFLEHLDRLIEAHVVSACNTFNGGKKTLDGTIGAHVGMGKRG